MVFNAHNHLEKQLDFFGHSTFWFTAFKPSEYGERQKGVLHNEFCSKGKVIELCKDFDGQGISCVAVNERPVGKQSASDVKEVGVLLFDIDVKKSRKVDFVSTDKDHEYAIEKWNYIRKILAHYGLSVDLVVDSGNGCHIFTKVKIDVSSKEKKKDFLQKVKALEDILGRNVNDEIIELDCITKDLNRRVKLAGTLNKKDTKQKIDRYSSIILFNEYVDVEKNNAAFNKIPKLDENKIYSVKKNEKRGKFKDKSRSAREYREVLKLLFQGKSKKEIFLKMQAFAKWTEAGSEYQEYTYGKALRYYSEKSEKYQDKKEENSDFINDSSLLEYFSSISSETYYLSDEIERKLNWKEVKTLTKKIYNFDKKLVFLYGNKNKFTGKLLSEVHPYKQQVHLITLYKREKEGITDYRINFFDDKIDRRGWTKKYSIKEKFWLYQFISEQCRYVVLSEGKLDLEYGDLDGMLVDIDDYAPLGSTAKIKLNLPIIISSKWNSFRQKISTKKAFVDLLQKLNISRRKYFNYIFSHPDNITYNHPKYFQELVSAFLLSSKIKAPLHLLVIAKPGTGKSTLEESIHHKFDEDEEIVEGSCSTLKALVPSFKGNLPAPGALLKSNRICVVDEFLRILIRVPSDERNEQLAALNPILEHKRRKSGSGNGGFRMSPTSRCLMVSNPVWGTSSIEKLSDKIDRSFLSRLFIWYQDEDHIRQIQSGVLKEKVTFKIKTEEWLAIVDFLHSFESEFDKEKVHEIFNKGLSLIGKDTYDNNVMNVREVYEARYQYHIQKMIDGIVKTRCLCAGTANFVAKKEDYELLENIWLRMILSWGIIKDKWVVAEIRGKIDKK